MSPRMEKAYSDSSIGFMKHLALRSFEKRHANPVTSQSDEHVGSQRQTGLSSSFWILNANFVAERRAVASARWKKHVFLTTAGIVRMI